MTQRLFINIGSRNRKDRMLLELPGDRPIREWMPDLVQVVGWRELADSPGSAFHLETEEGEPLPENRSLHEAGVSSSDLLFLGRRETPDPSIPPAEEAGPRGLVTEEEATGRAAAAPCRAAELLRQPRLTGPDGLVFLLQPLPAAIGRSGKGSAPDIDLAEWDAGMIVSRKHAVIENNEDGLSIRPEKTTNGTFINGVEVPAGVSRILRDGDRLHFGFKGLELVFRAAEKK